MLYRVLADHLETFFARAQADPNSAGLPAFVRRELRAFLDCGLLARGFCRVHCTACGQDDLVAFSCKGRGFCPSCGARRMSDLAAHLVDRVLPDVPIRQWVLALPHRVRFLCATDPAVCRGVRKIFVRAVTSFYLRRARRPERLRAGCVVFTQRFDSALRLNVHFHALWADGVFAFPSSGVALFHPTPAPADEDIVQLARALRNRILRWLRKQGRLDDDDGPAVDDPSALATLTAAAVQGRIPFGDAKGAHDPRLRDDDAPPNVRTRAKSELCADSDGFSLHAAVRVGQGARIRLEKLCRYGARPPVVHDRLALSKDGTKVVYALKRRYRDGSTHVVLDPLTFVARLAALIPRPRVNLTTYHGVFAPAASARERVVPEPLDVATPCNHAPPAATLPVTSPATGAPAHAPRPRRYSWAELMQRVFAIDVLLCRHCGGRRRLLAFFTDPAVVRRILEHLRLEAEPPTVAAARPPPQAELSFA